MAESISVRMYNVGFGDCFLLRFPSADGPRTVLIDCGVHFKGKGPRPIAEIVDHIIADVTSNGAARIDVVIATHRHQDHVSGFDNEAWADVDVGEVWLPWTEHPTDPEARKIRETQSKKALAIVEALRLAAAPAPLIALAENALTNFEAMKMLKDGFAGSPRKGFLPQKKRALRSFQPSLLPGVTVHAMGPSRDPEVIRDMNPPEGESFLRLAAAGSGRAQASPFRSDYAIGMKSELAKALFANASIDSDDLEAVETIAEEDPLSLVVALDKAVNGTSLLLMFEMGSQCLLFPGDAQWGTWQNALADPVWRELIERTTFLKVGHHGSHNSTPSDLITDAILPEGFRAMVCTNTKAFESIPRGPLMTALKTRTKGRIVRSDRTDAVAGFTREGTRFVETKLPI